MAPKCEKAVLIALSFFIKLKTHYTQHNETERENIPEKVQLSHGTAHIVASRQCHDGKNFEKFLLFCYKFYSQVSLVDTVFKLDINIILIYFGI